MAASVSCSEPGDAPGGKEEKVRAVKLGAIYLRGELRWAPVHKGCCLGRNGWVMRKVPAVLWVRGVQDVCFGRSRVLCWLSRALSLFCGRRWGLGGEGEAESVEVICESEVSIILAFRVRISRICRLPLGSAGPSAFCLVLAVWGHVIPLDLSTVGRDSGPIPSDIDRGELFLRAAGRGLFGPLPLAPIFIISNDVWESFSPHAT